MSRRDLGDAGVLDLDLGTEESDLLGELGDLLGEGGLGELAKGLDGGNPGEEDGAKNGGSGLLHDAGLPVLRTGLRLLVLLFGL